MKNYGRKIIDYIFGKRSNSTSIHYECEQKVQADSDRSDIRVFETWVSTQRHGDNRQSTRNAEEEECSRLIEIAKSHGLYILIRLIGKSLATDEELQQERVLSF